MTQGDAVKAYGTIIRMGQKATGAAAFVLFKLKKQLQEIFDFQREEEQKIIEKCGGVSEQGMILISDPEKRAECIRQLKELHALECEIQPVQIQASAIPEINLDEIEALDGFVEFI